MDFATEALRPFVNRYWQVEPIDNGRAVAAYADAAKSPALVERTLGEGRIVQFTTVLDTRRDPSRSAMEQFLDVEVVRPRPRQ